MPFIPRKIYQVNRHVIPKSPEILAIPIRVAGHVRHPIVARNTRVDSDGSSANEARGLIWH